MGGSGRSTAGRSKIRSFIEKRERNTGICIGKTFPLPQVHRLLAILHFGGYAIRILYGRTPYTY